MGLWSRTWQNKDKGQGDLILNDPDGWVIEAPGLTWLGSDQMGDFWGKLGAAQHNQGDASGLPAVTRATSLIVDSIAGRPWNVRRGTDLLDSPRWLLDPALARPDLRISDRSSSAVQPLSVVDWRSNLLVSALWWGDAFVWVPSRDQSGMPKPPLFVLNPAHVTVVEVASVEYPRPGYYVEVEGGPIRLDDAEVIHVRGMGPTSQGRGRGVLAAHSASWAEALSVRSYASSLYTAGIPAGYLKSTAPNMDDKQATALKDKWYESHGGGAARSIAVLNAVTDFVPIQLPPEQAQMVEAKRMSILDVANAFGVDPFMLGLPADGSTYANIESRGIHFVTYTLLPWARRVEAALSSEFAFGTDLDVDLTSLTRGDTAARVAYYSAGLTDGWLTADEVRELEGLPPLEQQSDPVVEPDVTPLGVVA